MTNEQPAAGIGDRIATALDEYMLAKEQGQQLSHTEFVARYPDFAGQLRECLQSIEFMNHASANFLASTPVSESTDRTLGDFRLRRELGRGGMGVVYEAEQISLGRLVAVKVLPFATFLDKRQLERFKNEARAAAMLKHPNIVSVFSVGCDRCVHFYAMELIAGQSLAEVISGLRQAPVAKPSSDTEPVAALSTLRFDRIDSFYRRVAKLGLQAADALAFAHQQGVVHRDIKPSNLLLDETGQLHVTDFGLARIQSAENLSVSHDVCGTLRYMSPEQAEGSFVDHRTDIYSLGATLYELLTFQPALRGEDRQELFRQLTDLRPTTPRTIDPRIPRDLESVVLKAMASGIEYRYRSAQEFAADLRRFLTAEPVHAQRPGRWQYMTRWVQRNRLLAALISVVVVLVTSLAVAGPYLAISSARMARAEATARQEAEAAKSGVQRLLAETLIETMVSLENTGGTDALLGKLLDKVRPQYEALIGEDDLSPIQRRDLAFAYSQLGNVLEFRFAAEDATQIQEKAVAVLEGLDEQLSDDEEYQHGLAKAYVFLALRKQDADIARKALEMMTAILSKTPHKLEYRITSCWSKTILAELMMDDYRLDEPEHTLISVVGAWQRLCKDHPDNVEARGGLCYSRWCLGRALLRARRFLRAERQFRLAIALPLDGINIEARFNVAQAHIRRYLGETLLRLRRPEEAEAVLRDGVQRLESLVHAYPGSGWARSALTQSRGFLFDSLYEQGDWRKAQAVLQESKAATNLYRMGWLHFENGDADLAHRWFSDAYAELLLSVEERSSHRLEEDYLRLSCLLSNCPDSAIRDAEKAVDFAEMAHGLSDHRDWRILGIALFRAGHLTAADDALKKSVDESQGGGAVDFFFLAMVNHRLGETAVANKWYERASEHFNKNLVGRFVATGYELSRIRSETKALLESKTQTSP